MTQSRMITQSGPLLNPDGTLAQVGWSRQPLLDCNLEHTHTTPLKLLQGLRLKRWDYYGLSTPEYYFSFTLADVGYAGSIFAYAIHLESGRCDEATLTVPLGKGVLLARNSSEGRSELKNEQVEMVFEAVAGERRVQMNWKEFGGKGKPDFCANLRYEAPETHESMNLVIPIKGRRFYFNRKINCLPTSGSIEYQGQRMVIDAATCLGNLDWGRGVWEYNSHWVWASASGFLPDGRTIGLNLGYGFGEPGAPSEHAVIVDGKIHKLEQVRFEFDSNDYTKAWRMTAADGRLALAFSPALERVARTDMKVLVTEVHQMFGTYRGRFCADSGEEIEIGGLAGFAEEHYARW